MRKTPLRKTPQQDRRKGGIRKGRIQCIAAKNLQGFEDLQKLSGHVQMDARELNLTIAESSLQTPAPRRPIVTLSISEFNRMVEGVELCSEEPRKATKKSYDHRHMLRRKGKRPVQIYTDNGEDFGEIPVDKTLDEYVS